MPNTEEDQYTEIFDAGHSGKEHTVHQRIRANSAVMEHKKILGTFPSTPRFCGAEGNIVRCQWLISG